MRVWMRRIFKFALLNIKCFIYEYEGDSNENPKSKLRKAGFIFVVQRMANRKWKQNQYRYIRPIASFPGKSCHQPDTKGRKNQNNW